MFICGYLIVCYKEKKLFDKSLTRNITHIIANYMDTSKGNLIDLISYLISLIKRFKNKKGQLYCRDDSILCEELDKLNTLSMNNTIIDF